MTRRPLRRVKDVRIVGVPAPSQVQLDRDGPALLAPLARRFSTSPCAQCNSRCCQEKVCINLVDLARLVLGLGVLPERLVTLNPEHQSTLTLPVLISGRATHLLLRQIAQPELPGPACHMLARPGGQLRCGVHGLRPGVCRAYPFRFVTDRGREHYVGLPFLCPVDWALAPATRRALELEIVAWRRDNDAAERWIRQWNREHGDQDAQALFRFAIERGGRRLGLDPGPYLRRDRPRSFSRPRLW